MLGRFFSSAIFSKGEKGVKISIIKRLRLIVIPKGEYIVRKGELGLDIYFIL